MGRRPRERPILIKFPSFSSKAGSFGKLDKFNRSQNWIGRRLSHTAEKKK
jgi:hypothetical protein